MTYIIIGTFLVGTLAGWLQEDEKYIKKLEGYLDKALSNFDILANEYEKVKVKNEELRKDDNHPIKEIED